MESLFYGYQFTLLKGMGVSLVVAFSALGVSILVGAILATFELSEVSFLKRLTFIFRTIVRGVPDVVWMLLLYFGGQILLNKGLDRFLPGISFEFNPFFVAIAVIGVFFSSYMAETFHGGYLAISKGIIEAGHALGLKRSVLFLKVIFPLLFKNCLPGVMNIWLTLLKSTAAVGMIGMTDLVASANDAGNSTRHPFQFWIYVTIFYLLLTLASEYAQKKMEQKLAMCGS